MPRKIPKTISDMLTDIIVSGETITPPLNLDEINASLLAIYSAQVELEAQRDNIKQRKKTISFILWFILIQLVLTFGALFYGMYLMSHDKLIQEEYDWIFRVLQISIGSIGVEIVGYLGIVMHYLFRNDNKKVKKNTDKPVS